LSRCIRNRSIKALAVAQQVYNRTRGRPSGDDRIASSFRAGNVKRGYGLIRGEGAWRSGKFDCNGRCFGWGRCERGRALTPHDRCRLRGGRRWSDGIRFNQLLVLYLRDAENKCCTTCRDKYGSRRNDFCYRNSCHSEFAISSTA
jgi:hypothetical protein